MADHTGDGENSAFVDRWRSQLIELQPEVQAVHTNRILFRALVEAIRTHASETPAIWQSHYAGLYAASQMMSLRRIVRGKSEAGELSLTTILLDIQKHPQAFTFAHHLEGGSGYSDEFLERYRQRFLAEWGDDGGLYPEKVRADRAELMKLTRDVIDWADQVIAHSYPREQRPATVTYGDLDRAIDDMTGTYNRYRELLTATSIAFEGTAIDPAWVTTFDRPLFPHPRFEGFAES